MPQAITANNNAWGPFKNLRNGNLMLSASFLFHSILSALTGSSFDARRAGK
jgi:hypothetical protein